MRIAFFIPMFSDKDAAHENSARNSRTQLRCDWHPAVFPCLRVSASITLCALSAYCFGFGVVVAAPVVFALALCFGLAFIAPAGVNETICGSPGTLVSVN